MCLAQVFTKKEREEVLTGLSEEFTVWKVVADWGEDHKEREIEFRYTTDCVNLPVHAGEMRFKTNTIDGHGVKYRGGGHFWLYKKNADDWSGGIAEKVVRCRIKKEWITNMGKQDGRIVIVVKKAVFPKYIGQMGVKAGEK